MVHFPRLTPKPEIRENSSIIVVKASIPSSEAWARTASSA